MIVDHQLRPESRTEALDVAAMLSSWGLSPMILRWDHPPMNSALMERARQGRYAALALACHQQGIKQLFLGHHQDDMLETVWMRQQAGGPAYGFSGMSAITMRYGVIVLRPFLDRPKRELEALLREHGVHWIQDPTNENPRFYRTQARQQLKNGSLQCRNQAWDQICRQGAQRQAHEARLRTLCQPIHHPGAIIAPEFQRLIELPLNDGCLWIQSLVHSFGFRPIPGIAGQVRAWQALCKAFKNRTVNGRIIITFGGCIFVRDGNDLWLFREYGRISPHAVSSTQAMWDDRVFSQIPMTINRAVLSQQGSWHTRFTRSSLPQDWDPAVMTYYACAWPYPHFSTINT
jgi:tRNA(Ile)-lysidine synthase